MAKCIKTKLNFFFLFSPPFSSFLIACIRVSRLGSFFFSFVGLWETDMTVQWGALEVNTVLRSAQSRISLLSLGESPGSTQKHRYYAPSRRKTRGRHHKQCLQCSRLLFHLMARNTANTIWNLSFFLFTGFSKHDIFSILTLILKFNLHN